MSVLDVLHGSCVHGRRVQVLAAQLAALLPARATVLDVGCGDGALAARVAELRPDLRLRGLDVLVRPHPRVPVEPFDGRAIPAADGSVDVVLFVDVLHHTEDPLLLLREARRVARQSIAIKDHTRDGLLAGPTLRFMDWIGNARHGVSLPYNYWPEARWHAAFAGLDVRVGHWHRGGLGLYPAPAGWIFGRRLHFVARLDLPGWAP